MKKFITFFICSVVAIIAFFGIAATKNEQSDFIILKQEIVLPNENIEIYYNINKNYTLDVYCEKDLNKYNPNLLKSIKSTTISIVKNYKGKLQYHSESINETLKIANILYQKYGHLIDIDKIIK